MSAKSDLVDDLKQWFLDGANQVYPSAVLGLLAFQAFLTKFCIQGADAYGNKLMSFTGAEFLATVGALPPTPDSTTPALFHGSGLSLSFAAKTLGVTNLPPGALSIVANTITSPPAATPLQNSFKEIFDTDFSSVLAAAPDPETATEFLAQSLADKWADVIEDAVKDATWTMNYILSGVPPTPSSATGKLTI
jgi:hypothetical protein